MFKTSEAQAHRLQEQWDRLLERIVSARLVDRTGMPLSAPVAASVGESVTITDWREGVLPYRVMFSNDDGTDLVFVHVRPPVRPGDTIGARVDGCTVLSS